MIDQRLDTRHELDGVGQLSVEFECPFICPVRVNVEQPRIADGAKGLDAKAAGFLARALDLSAQHGRDGGFMTFAGVKTGEDEQFHSPVSVAWLIVGLDPQLTAMTG